MIRLTDFSEFRRTVESLGLPIIIDEIKRTLEIGEMDADLENLIFGESGIYGILEQEGKLFLTKIILHIADKDMRFLRKVACKYVYANDFDSIELIEEVHKYHLFFCATLKTMFKNDRKHRYKQSHRQDGKFSYQFVDSKRIFRRKEQILYFCKHCLKKFNSIVDCQVFRNQFYPSMFFDQIPQLQWLPDCSYPLDTQNMPTNYDKDYRKLHKKVKQRKNYCCEHCTIDLNEQHLQKYVDCHHINANISDNRFVNLKCLCVKCHAEQFQHSHMKRDKRYLDFLPIWEKKFPA